MKKYYSQLSLVALLVVIAMSYFVMKAFAAPILPAGFSRVAHSCGMSGGNLTDFAFISSGSTDRICIGKDGVVNFATSKDQITPLAQLNVDNSGDLGLISIGLDQNYSNNGRFYLLYTYKDSVGSDWGRVENWYVNNPASPTSAHAGSIVIDGVSQIVGGSHGPGTLRVDKDNTLYVGFGDASSFDAVDPQALRALDSSDPHGKILHINGDGSGVGSNANYNASAPNSWSSRVFAMGFRNPFRFSIDHSKVTTQLYVGDVGWNTWEEINVVQNGKSYGWPCFEGLGHTQGYQDLSACQSYYSSSATPLAPLWTYNHSGQGSAVVGGIFYSGTSYPANYQNSFFFGDYARNCLYTIATDGNTISRAPESNCFSSNSGGPVEILPGPNGDLYYADINTGTVWQLQYTPGNQIPTAQFSATSSTSLKVSADATESYDPDNDALTYMWDFGDGSSHVTSSTPTISHTYVASGKYTITLTVSDPSGASNTTSRQALPGHSSPTITWDAQPTVTYKVGDSVAVHAKAIDQNGADITNTIAWTSYIKHCPQVNSCHIHPSIGATGPTFATIVSDHGDDSELFVTATAQDSLGSSSTLVYQVLPRLRTLSIISPSTSTINGYVSSNVQVVAGSLNSVSVPQNLSSQVFAGWSDGGGPSHSLTMPDADLTLTASFMSAIDQKATSVGFLGNPINSEFVLTDGGHERDFQYGRVYWSFDTGAHEVHGGILGKFLAKGGPLIYGYPTTDEQGSIDGIGRYNNFTGGVIYWTPTTNSHEVHGGILDKWTQLGRERGNLGYPTTDEKAITGGRISYFQHGSIRWNRLADTYTVATK